MPYDIKITIKFPTGETTEAGVNIRPWGHRVTKFVERQVRGDYFHRKSQLLCKLNFRQPGPQKITNSS